ncbi:MAG: hypothetical protein OXJ55_17920, partial [Caldilineaceae bacterium]|nr:hypothetical protein [Caldilineaceae bacterium]
MDFQDGWDKAGTCGDLVGLEGGGLAGHFRIGTWYEYRNPVDEAVGGRWGGGAPPPRGGGEGP